MTGKPDLRGPVSVRLGSVLQSEARSCWGRWAPGKKNPRRRVEELLRCVPAGDLQRSTSANFRFLIYVLVHSSLHLSPFIKYFLCSRQFMEHIDPAPTELADNNICN